MVEQIYDEWAQMRGELQSVNSRAVQRQRALMEVALRPDQLAFAAQVRKSWRDRCRLAASADSFATLAHLVNFASCDAKGAADPGNGIFPAAHLHKAFNRHRFGISPDGEIVCIWR